MNEFVNLVLSNGVEGLVAGLVVLLAVYSLSFSGVVVTGDQKRVANVVLSILLAGVSIVNPESQDVIVTAIASISSALLYEIIRYFASRK